MVVGLSKLAFSAGQHMKLSLTLRAPLGKTLSNEGHGLRGCGKTRHWVGKPYLRG